MIKDTIRIILRL